MMMSILMVLENAVKIS